jgi:hypothetical protein
MDLIPDRDRAVAPPSEAGLVNVDVPGDAEVDHSSVQPGKEGAELAGFANVGVATNDL